MGSVGDELLVARLRADESRRWRRGASMASWAASKWAQPRDRGTPRITKTGKGDAGNTPGRRRRRRRASSSARSRRRPSRRRAGAASTRPRGAARPRARLRSRGSASMASGGVLSPRTECRENATPRRRGGGAPQDGASPKARRATQGRAKNKRTKNKRRTPQKHRSERVLGDAPQVDDLAAAAHAVGRDDARRARAGDARRERVAREAPEDHRVDGPNPRAREHGDRELGDHRHE